MKILIVMLSLTFILAVILSPLLLFAHWGNEAEKLQHQRDQEWLQFSMQHHCRIIKEPGFWGVDVTWQCDGNFQVVRNPNS